MRLTGSFGSVSALGNPLQSARNGHWYNYEHRHSRIRIRIRFVTQAQRHRGEDQEVLAKRHALRQQARNQHPHRWSGRTRNWQPIGTVTLNPEKEQLTLELAA